MINKVPDAIFSHCVNEAQAYADRDHFVSDMALSSIWEGDPEADVHADRIAYLARVWDVAHMSIRDIRKATGLSQLAFASRFCIPRRTVEGWETTNPNLGRDCPLYTRLLLARACGLIDGSI